VKLQTVLGAKDLNPKQVEINHLLSKELAMVYKKWGYEEVAPPILERMPTLMAGGAIANDDIIKVVADEALGLRPEMTASIARAASTRFANKQRPLRLWSSGIIYKNKEAIERGTFIEERLQSGVELFGVNEISAEIELLIILLESYQRLNINKIYKPTLLIGHTKLFDLILSELEPETRNIARGILTKYDKLDLENLKIDRNKKNKLKKILELRGESFKVIEELRKIYGENVILKKLIRLFKVIEPISNKEKVDIQLDPTFLPHFELYNGLVFQLVCETNTNPIVIARGGRYDEIVRTFSKEKQDASGVGFSFAIDTIRELIKDSKFKEATGKCVLIAYGTNRCFEDTLERQEALHSRGLSTIIEHEAFTSKDLALEKMRLRGLTEIEWID
tara:strand:- start:8537 stop:9712 length:1176 start_codon:yes stop_codon:yes gene_type:complete